MRDEETQNSGDHDLPIDNDRRTGVWNTQLNYIYDLPFASGAELVLHRT
jgi:hypothetical protein